MKTGCNRKLLMISLIVIVLSGCNLKSDNKNAVGRYVPLGNTMMILDTTTGAAYKPMDVLGHPTWELFIPQLTPATHIR